MNNQADKEIQMRRPTPDWGERLRYVIGLRRTNQSALARATGLSKGLISQYVNCQIPDPGRSSIDAICHTLQVSQDWLLHNVGSGPDEPGHNYAVAGRTAVPVIGAIRPDKEGTWREAVPPVAGEASMPARTTDPNAYQYIVESDDLYPIRYGWRLVVEPGTEPQNGNLVLVVTTDGRNMVKELLRRENGRVVLDSITGEAGRVTLEDAEIETLHRIGDIALP